MKKYFLVLSFLPLISIAQKSTKNAKPTSAKVATAKAANGFTITGTIDGYPDNTPIDVLNPNTGTPEASGKIVAGKFLMKGTLPFPDFRIMAVNSQPPYLSIFLDNSIITVRAKKSEFEKAEIKGSLSHNDFVAFSKVAKPYEQLLAQPGTTDEATVKNAAIDFEKFINEHPASYVTPLVIYRYNQVTSDNDKLEAMYNKLPANTKNASIGAYLATLIKENKKNPLGKPLANFIQADTAGNSISLASFKGKYVLVDFWASWCGPCRQENPNIVSTYNKYKNKNFTVLGVSLDKSKEPWLQAIKSDGLAWTHVSDLKGWNNAVSQQFEIFSIPQSFLLDPQGNVVGKNLRGPALEAKLAELIN